MPEHLNFGRDGFADYFDLIVFGVAPLLSPFRGFSYNPTLFCGLAWIPRRSPMYLLTLVLTPPSKLVISIPFGPRPVESEMSIPYLNWLWTS